VVPVFAPVPSVLEPVELMADMKHLPDPIG
jgi:hypothetical protein